MAKPIIRWPDCRCGWYPLTWCLDAWDRTKERGEWAPIPICRKNAGCLYWTPYEYTSLKQCGRCGRLGSGHRIKYRGDCYLGLDESRGHDDTLTMCMSCWNKVRPIVKRINIMRKCQTLANKIRRVAHKKQR